MSAQTPRRGTGRPVSKPISWDSPEGVFVGLIALLVFSTVGPMLIPQVREKVSGWAAPVITWVHDARPAALEDIPIQPEGSERGYSRAAFGGAVRGDLAVTLPEAWRSGASSWTKDERAAFAHDPNLVLPAGADRCTVAGRVVQIKYSYHLSMDSREAAAVQRDQSKC